MTFSLVLQRKPSTEFCTHGDLFIGDQPECVTLEDVVRQEKVFGKTAIPAGRYYVFLSFSPRFGRVLPLIADVSGFVGVRIHPGNSSKDTEGCILVGTSRPDDQKDWIIQSRKAFNALFAKMQEAVDRGEKIEITIKDAL